MHPGSRTGVRFVLANPSDPSRLDEFTDWYDTYSAAITVPGYLASDVRFENPDASCEHTSPPPDCTTPAAPSPGRTSDPRSSPSEPGKPSSSSPGMAGRPGPLTRGPLRLRAR